MQIPMAYKVESYKESLFMGFPLRQSLHMIAGMVVIGTVMALMVLAFHINILIAMYIGLPFAAPIIIAGFPNEAGMTKIDVIRKKKEIKSYGTDGRLTYGTGMNEEFLKRLEITDKNKQEDDFSKAMKKMIIVFIAGIIATIAIIIFILIKIAG